MSRVETTVKFILETFEYLIVTFLYLRGRPTMDTRTAAALQIG